jgi:hypothetical protein
MLSHRAQSTTGLALQMAGGVGALAGGVMTGGVGLLAGAGIAGNSLGAVAMELAKRKDLQNTPQTVRHLGNNLEFDLCDYNYGLFFLRYSVHENIKKILADYWNKYGYKCGEVKIPSLRSRYYFNYIKTIGCNITGNFDNKDIAKLKTIFDDGITIWHDRAGVTPLDYSYNNIEMNLLS